MWWRFRHVLLAARSLLLNLDLYDSPGLGHVDRQLTHGEGTQHSKQESRDFHLLLNGGK
jgi:hypothetical protein